MLFLADVSIKGGGGKPLLLLVYQFTISYQQSFCSYRLKALADMSAKNVSFWTASLNITYTSMYVRVYVKLRQLHSIY